jgi:hypothetical protein
MSSETELARVIYCRILSGAMFVGRSICHRDTTQYTHSVWKRDWP